MLKINQNKQKFLRNAQPKLLINDSQEREIFEWIDSVSHYENLIKLSLFT